MYNFFAAQQQHFQSPFFVKMNEAYLANMGAHMTNKSVIDALWDNLEFVQDIKEGVPTTVHGDSPLVIENPMTAIIAVCNLSMSF
jgi:hypothetical protein